MNEGEASESATPGQGVRAARRAKITKRAVDALEACGAAACLWDSELRGFGVRALPSGLKCYMVKYLAGRRQRWFTIGRHGVFTADEARREARRILGEVARGRDPAEARDCRKAAPTMETLARRFLAEHVDAKCKASTAREYRRLFDKMILPRLGRLRAREVTRDDVARFHQALKPTPGSANRALAVLSKFFNWAELHGERPEGSNPCRHIEKFPGRKCERFLSEAELGRLSAALAEAERNGTEPPAALACIRLLLLTGARLGEIRTLKWAYVDFEREWLRLPDSKTGAKVIHLNAPAREVLAALPKVEGNPYVLPGAKDGACIVGVPHVWERIRSRAGLRDVRLHDLRHSFASVGAAAGLSLPMIGALLGHRQVATTGRYAHLAADPVKQAGDIIGRRIAAAMKGGSAPPAPVSAIGPVGGRGAA